MNIFNLRLECGAGSKSVNQDRGGVDPSRTLVVFLPPTQLSTGCLVAEMKEAASPALSSRDYFRLVSSVRGEKYQYFHKKKKNQVCPRKNIFRTLVNKIQNRCIIVFLVLRLEKAVLPVVHPHDDVELGVFSYTQSSVP